MTDKVLKIRAFLVGIADADGVSAILARAIEKEILPYIDSLQEKPVSEGKAEQRALERFPVHEGASKEWIEMHLKGVCAEYIEGYHQAEKDLELTWEDIKTIDKLLNQCVDCNNPYQEVLKRFKDLRQS